jgi:hypothetical protein
MSNKSKQKVTVNGNQDLDTPQMKAMRQLVVEQELSARSWKAYYEKMYYTIESEKIEPAYNECVERQNKRKQEINDLMEKIKNNSVDEFNQENSDKGKIELSEEGESTDVLNQEEAATFQ